jgi:hypothetical protein
MTDKELLELAAKAIGEKCDQLGANAFGLYKPKEGYMQPYIEWNPLTDDGDALRLAVKLEIALSFDRSYPDGKLVARVCCAFGDTLYGDAEPADLDPYAATRRAITRAAAEIGKAKCE